jgi:hypothetical protein
MPSKNGGNGKSHRLTDEQLKSLAELTLQNDERIEQLWDMVIELKLAAIRAGWKLKDAQEWQDAARSRSESAGIDTIQRQRFRKSLGLE